ncbi:MAG: threonine ammonia-lyase [Sulfobacillus thermosulfidooxidans]|nr:MAG: threonine ammonia-lyase [Sulfobacillus thermosulfidooxidans]
MTSLDLALIQDAYAKLRPVVHQTPLFSNRLLSQLTDCDLYLKAENLQITGSFKIRGALNKVSAVAQTNASGVVTGSSGNHGQAVAWAARFMHLTAQIVVPTTAPAAKVEAALSYGAQVEYCGTTSHERLERAQQIAKDTGMTFVPPYDDPLVMAGQGTIGLEILEQRPDVQTVLIPIGGGGLISGIATAIKSLRPDIRVIGVEPLGAAKAYQSRQAHARITLPSTDTIADGLKSLALGTQTYPIIERLVDDLVTVDDDEIRYAMGLLLTRQKLLTEPSGAATTAYALRRPAQIRGQKVVALISGGNIDVPTLCHQLNP